MRYANPAQARMIERGAIVKWLRTTAVKLTTPDLASILMAAANDIEEGRHHLRIGQPVPGKGYARAIEALARALVRAKVAHSQATSFKPGWLAFECGAPPAVVQGRIGRDHHMTMALFKALIEAGWKGTKPSYARSAWVV